MSLDTLRDFMARLEAAGELVRVDRPVSVVREIAEIADNLTVPPAVERQLRDLKAGRQPDG